MSCYAVLFRNYRILKLKLVNDGSQKIDNYSKSYHVYGSTAIISRSLGAKELQKIKTTDWF